MNQLLKELEAVARLIRKDDEWNAMREGYALLRTHHAEIAEALKDARRYRAARECAGSVGIYQGSPSLDSGVSLLLGDDADAAIDAHNSAREAWE